VKQFAVEKGKLGLMVTEEDRRRESGCDSVSSN
jgi:hypothetical protein